MTSDGCIRIKGCGQEEVRIGVTVGKRQVFFGLKGRHGEIGCVDLSKRDFANFIDLAIVLEKEMLPG